MGGVFRRWGRASWFAAGALALSLAGCDNSPWNTGAAGRNVLYTAMQESSPRHLDPTASYWSNDTPYTYKI